MAKIDASAPPAQLRCTVADLRPAIIAAASAGKAAETKPASLMR